MKLKVGHFYKFIFKPKMSDEIDVGKSIIFKVTHIYHSESGNKGFYTGYTIKDERVYCPDEHIVFFRKYGDDCRFISLSKDEVMVELL